jgi:integral membrane sensor domain MASE1
LAFSHSEIKIRLAAASIHHACTPNLFWNFELFCMEEVEKELFGKPWSKNLFLVSSIALIYFSVAHAGLFIAFEKTNASPVWPASGFAFAMILFFGYKIWPAIFAGALAANILVFQSNGIALSTSIITSLLIASGNTLEALIGKFFLNRFSKTNNPFYKSTNFFTFLGTTLFMCAVSSSIGALSVVQMGVTSSQLLSSVWLTWWAGNIGGIIILNPLLISWLNKPDFKISIKKQMEAIVIFLAILVLSLVVFDMDHILKVEFDLPVYSNSINLVDDCST